MGLLAGLGVLVGVQVLFSLWAAGCVDGVLVPGCNPSATIDPAVFTDPHIYVGGTRGHDPEGLTVIVSAAGTALLGVAAGSILGRWRTGGAAPRLLALAGGLGAMALVVDVFVMPVSKRLWTPSFALLAGACTALLLAVTHVLVDRRPAGRPSTARAVSGWSEWLVAFGRNSLLIYFGRYVVDSVLANVSLGRLTDGVAVRPWTIDWIRSWSPVPPVTWLVVMLAGWTLVAVTLHRRRRYIRV